MKKVFDTVLDAIGNTPIIRLKETVKDLPQHYFYAKLEFMNPGGSVKDRIALAIVKSAENQGLLKEGGTLVEATSGNTGVGLAMVAAIRGYRCIFVMPEKISEEKRGLLRAYGAEVVMTPTGLEPDDPRSHYSVAKKIAVETPGAYLTNQYHNPANPEAHYLVTGPEIWEQMGSQLTAFVAGAGTGGTISGVGRYLKEQKPQTQLVLADPFGSILTDLLYHGQVLTPPHSYDVEGVGEDMLPDNVHLKLINDSVQVSDQQAFHMVQRLAKQEGLCVGPSSALALVAAKQWAEKQSSSQHILVLFPDHGRSYLSKAFNEKWLLEKGYLLNTEC
jgi:cystathionine beta-synthase